MVTDPLRLMRAATLGALTLSTAALAQPQLSPAPVAPRADLVPAPAHVAGRVVARDGGFVYQWPGLYFETAFEGRSAYFKVGDGPVILRASVDGQALPLLVKPAPGLYQVSQLAPGRHQLRVEVLTEHQAGPKRFGGFLLPADARAAELPRRARRMEFIGDSHTVGYGNTSAGQQCTDEQVWATTDNTLAYGPLTARHYGADYRVHAISGRGVVRNFDGFAAPHLPEAYPFALLDAASPRDDSAWQPHVIAIALGTNDFSTPLKPTETWKARADLQADYEQAYAAFLKQLRARHPRAYLVVWATDPSETRTHAEAVVKRLQAAGESRIRFLPVNGLTMGGCNWHPSAADHRRVSELLVRVVDEVVGVWGESS